MQQEKYYDLSSSQKLLGLAQKYTLHKQVNNVYTLFLLKTELDFTVLRQAIELTYKNNDTLRLRFGRIDKKIKQYYVSEETPSLEMLDFEGKDQQQIDEILYRLAGKPFYIKNRCMSKVYFVKNCNGMNGIFWGVSHMILDSWGVCTLLKYIMDVYNFLKFNADMPKPLYSHKEQLILDLGYNNTPQYKKDLEFWRNETQREEPFYTDIRGSSILENFRKKKKDPSLRCFSTFTLRTKAKHEIITISNEDIQRMEVFCNNNKVSLHVLFLLGVRAALSKLNGRQKDVSFYSPIARRGTLAEKYSGGTRVLAINFRTIIEENCSVMDALQIIRERQSLLYRHSEIDSMEVMDMMRKAYHPAFEATYLCMAFTFQPVKLVLDDGTPCYSRWYCNGAASQPAYLTMMDDNGSGGIVCYYEYQSYSINSGHILSFHNLMMKIILAAITNKEMTVGELMDIAP